MQMENDPYVHTYAMYDSSDIVKGKKQIERRQITTLFKAARKIIQLVIDANQFVIMVDASGIISHQNLIVVPHF